MLIAPMILIGMIFNSRVLYGVSSKVTGLFFMTAMNTHYKSILYEKNTDSN